MRRAAVTSALLGASCYTSALPPVDEAPPRPAAALTIADAAIGPLTPQTAGNLLALRAALGGFDVRPVHVALGTSRHWLGYAVGKQGDKLLQVFADDAGAIFSVHAVSAKVAVADRPWRVGAALTSVRALSTCTCWMDEIVVCFNAGERVAVAIARACESDMFTTPEERQDLIGASIHRVLWSPAPYLEDSQPYGDPYPAEDEN